MVFIMSTGLMISLHRAIPRKWLSVSNALSRNFSLQFYQNRHRNLILPENYNLTCSQCRLLYISTCLNKRRKTKEEKKLPKEFTLPESKFKQRRVIQIWLNMTVKELAKALELSVDDLFEVMEYVPKTDMYVKPSSVIDNFVTIQHIVKQMNCRWTIVSKDAEKGEKTMKDAVRQPPPDPSVLVRRFPVVTVMGHVDHGKTTLLDTLRNTSVVEREFGGITQHIGAFSVKLKNNKQITFLDTPGHAAFSAMRSRGAHATDIVVLVVAADDGVMEQTDESVRMAREAKVPIVVAINKIDKPQADIEGTKKMLLMRGIQIEDSGGDVQCVPISALKGTNIDTLIDAIMTQAELMELKADPKGLCEGIVIEAKNDPKKGKLVTMIVQRGRLKVGTIVVAGLGWAKVRAMFDDQQQKMDTAEPATPVETMGWRELPSAGDIVLEVDTEKRAREVIDWREAQMLLEKSEKDLDAIKRKEEEHQKVYQARLEERRRKGYRRYKSEGPREKEIKDDDTFPKVSIIIKGDVDGSVEAILDTLMTYRSDICKLDIVHFEVGSVSVSDVELAEAFNGIIYAFNVEALPDAKEKAVQKEVKIHYHNVIYRLIDDLKTEINKVLPLIDDEEIIGEADVQQQFLVSEGKKKVPVAGCKCVTGVLKKSALFRLIRNDEIIHEGPLVSMRHLKDEVDTIKKDTDCGLRFADSTVLFEPNDTLVCFKPIKKEQFTDWDPGF